MVKRKLSTLPTMEDKNMLDEYSPNKVGRIIPTSKKPRLNAFESMRPRKEQCLDYKISQTFANFQRGDLKINVKETHATYEPLPPEVCKKIAKKVTRFHGIPPQWEFLDEIWLKQREIVQKKAVAEMRHASAEKIKSRRKKKIKEHDIVQRLVGPEWFMELSPNQLHAIDHLYYAIYKDLRDRTVVNTQEIMATLGLVLRPNQRHLEIALKHSCGSPIEFLLVLYQILDPKRETYSLNDRLILSSVAHLAITDTLKELHVRIPSPPNVREPNVEKKVRKEKKHRYKSPYLQPQTFHPTPPKFTGVYENKHIQFPESPYFAYLPVLDIERRQFKTIVRDLRKNLTAEERERWKEYDAVQNFYQILPGAMDTPMLLPAAKLKICWNMLNKRIGSQPPIIHLAQLGDTDDEECCNCQEVSNKKRADNLAKRSTCDKGATKFLQQNLPCDECLEKQLLKNSVKILGGFVKMTCPCDHVPVILGTCLTKPCPCFIDYRDRVVVARQKQHLTDCGTKHVISGITMSKFGPIYNLSATLGDPDCKCHEIQQIKKWKRKEKSKLIKNKSKFIIGGVQMTKEGPVYIFNNTVARKACSCIEKYRNSLIVAETQHQLKQNQAKFVFNGVINTKEFGPVYSFAGAFEPKIETKISHKPFCSCMVKKPKCLEKCQDRSEYRDVYNEADQENVDCKKDFPPINAAQEIDTEHEHDQTSSSDEETETTSSSEEESSSADSTYSSSSESYVIEESTISNKANKKGAKRLCEICQKREDDRDKYCGVIKSDFSSASTVSNPAKCKCKEALGKFMDEQCQCEDCMAKLRRGYATHIFGGTKLTASGNILNLVQGIHQPQCSCMHDHLNKMKKAEEYKTRAVLRYKMMTRPEKYSISGVTMTADGPVYNISGMMPPVECDCAVEIRRRQQEEEERQRMPKIPPGRAKFSVVGVRQLSKENVYVLGNAVEMEECDCMKMLKKFEEAHRGCVEEFDKFLGKIEEEKKQEDGLDTECLNVGRRSTDLQFIVDDENFGDGTENLQTDVTKEDQKKDRGDYDNSEEKLDKSTENKPANKCICNQNDRGDYNDDEVKQKEENIVSESEAIDETTDESSSEYDSETDDSDSESGDFGPCTIPKIEDVKPIVLKERIIPEYFLSKRYVIFKKMPEETAEQERILKHILEGMADDGFPLAKLPEVYQLPVFKLWWEMRCGIYWTQADRHRYVNKSIGMWDHTDLCYKEPDVDQLPFTQEDVKRLTWANAKMIKSITTKYSYNYYRKVKQVTIATGREFFAPTFDYQFPTRGWRDCAFAYIPTKEEAVFPYKIYQPHEARTIPTNKKFRCYC